MNTTSANNSDLTASQVDPNFLFKLVNGSDIRRVTRTTFPHENSLIALQNYVQAAYNLTAVPRLTYLDGDGDSITIGSDAELIEARRSLGARLKINVEPTAATFAPANATPSAPPIDAAVQPSAPPSEPLWSPTPTPPQHSAPTAPSFNPAPVPYNPAAVPYNPAARNTTTTPPAYNGGLSGAGQPVTYPDISAPHSIVANTMGAAMGAAMLAPVYSMPAPMMPCLPRLCSAGHCLVYAAPTHGGYANGWTCDGCASMHSVYESRWNCAQCRFDLCSRCCDATGARSPLLHCRAGHVLRMSGDNSGLYSRGFTCDICRAHRPRGELRWNCRSCEYDVCQSCSHRISPMPPVICQPMPMPMSGAR